MDISTIVRIGLFGLITLVVWMLLVDGIVGRAAYNAHPQITHYGNSVTNRPVFVYFTGTQSSATAHSAQLRELWRQRYDVVIVEYSRNQFDAPVIVADTHQWLREQGYRRVILDGASLGMLLVMDLIDYDRANGNLFEFAVISQDGLSGAGADDLYQATAAKFFSKWDAGPVANWLFTRLVWKLMFNPPPRETLGSGVDDDLLAEHYQASKTWPMSTMTAQLRYDVKRRDYHDGRYAGIPLIVMVSEDDTVVKPEAADRLIALFGGCEVFIRVPYTTHAGFMEYPDAWWQKFEEAFAALDAVGW